MAHGNEQALLGNTNAVKTQTRNKSIKIYIYPDELIQLCEESDKLGYTNVNQYARDKLVNNIIDQQEIEAIAEDFSDMEGWNELTTEQQQNFIEMQRLVKE